MGHSFGLFPYSWLNFVAKVTIAIGLQAEENTFAPEKQAITMTSKEIIELLERAQIKPTANRILVYEAISGIDNTFSLADVEAVADTLDKSSIFRVLTLFLEHGLVHAVDDGSGMHKYCLCHHYGHCDMARFHYHFYCVQCSKTYCLPVPTDIQFSLPTGFVAHSTNFVIKGLCDKCSANESC